MNKLSAFSLAAGLTLLLPVQAQSQADPALIGQGAQVYSTTCARCHNVRPSSERTDREWMAIVAHMRARANMSKSHAAAVLAFLQATNLPETGAGMASAAGASMVIPESLRAVLDEAATLLEPPRRAVETASGNAERTPSGRGG